MKAVAGTVAQTAEQNAQIQIHKHAQTAQNINNLFSMLGCLNWKNKL